MQPDARSAATCPRCGHIWSSHGPRGACPGTSAARGRTHNSDAVMSSAATTESRAFPGSEFDLQPGERKLSCGCYVGQRIDHRWQITGQAFLCDRDHRLFEEVDPDA